MDVVKTRKQKKLEENKLNTLNLQHADTKETKVQGSARIERGYHELPGLKPDTRDVLKQLQNNISTLEDLGGRLGFALTELRSLIRR